MMPTNVTDMPATADPTAAPRLPDLRLARTPTPLHPIANFRRALQEECPTPLPELYIKRDDTTGFGFGGNKARHMGIAFAQLLADGVETVVNINHYHSNQARFIAAACAKTGLRCHLVAVDMVDAPLNGNLLLATMFGAQIRRVPADYAREVAERLRDDELRSARHAVIYADHPLTGIAGMLAYFGVGEELQSQLIELGIASGGDSRSRASDRLASGASDGTDASTDHAAGTGNGAGTRVADADDASPVHIWGLTGRSSAGLSLYAKHAGLDWRTSAVRYTPRAADVTCCDADADFARELVARSEQAANVLGIHTTLAPGDVQVVDGYAGTAYGIPDDGVLEAMHLLAQTEGIILDPNYTGKSMSGLIGTARAGDLAPDVPVVFLHSGGLPQVFAHADAIWGHGG